MTMRLGINLSFVNDSTTEQPFLDVFKTGSQWFVNNFDFTQQTNIQVDSNGWVTSLNSIGGGTFSNVTMRLFNTMSTPYYPSGHYAVLYAGSGTLTYGFDATLVSSSAGRDIITVAAPSDSGTLINITATDPGNIGNYIRNIQVVYAPTATNTIIDPNEVLLANGVIFNPTFIARISPFKCFRFVDWVAVFANTPTQTWAGRTQLTQAFWGIPSVNSQQIDPVTPTVNAYGGGINLGVGPPFEVMIDLCNQCGADGWFSLPWGYSDSDFTNFASLTHSTLNTNLYAELADEVWSGVDPTSTDMTMSGQAIWPMDTVRTAPIASLVWSGGTVTVTTSSPHQIGTNTIPIAISGASPSGYNVLGTSGTLATITGASTFTYPVASNPGTETSPGAYALAVPGFVMKYSYYTKRTSSMADILVSTWGADAGRVATAVNTQAGQGTVAEILLGYPSTNNIYGPVSTKVKALATAPYFGGVPPGMPPSWTADSDLGVSKLFTQLTDSSLVPPLNLGATATAGTSTALTFTSGQGLSGTPPNQTLVQVKFAWTGGTSGDPIGTTPTLKVDSCSPFPIQDYQGNPLPGTTSETGEAQFGNIVNLVFTSFTSAGAVTAGWRYQDFGLGTSAIQAAINDAAAIKSVAVTSGLQLVGYEGGFGLSVPPWDDAAILNPMYRAAMRDGRAGSMLLAYLYAMQTEGLTLLNDYDDIRNYTNNFWGALENVLQTSAPKYNALIQFLMPSGVAAGAISNTSVNIFRGY